MKKIGVIVNTKRPRAEGILAELRTLTQQFGFELFAEDEGMAKALDAKHVQTEDFRDQVDVVLAMGGDGTVLYTARALDGADVPILGINLGSLGFLTSVADSELAQAMKALAENTFVKVKRDAAVCKVFRNDALIGEDRSLNDMVLGWGASSRIVTLNLSIDGESISSFMCDGMIISTPTGSTGHSLSSGGPILHPDVAGFGINVICPHTLSSRPLVVPNNRVIEVDVIHAVKELILSIDGQDGYKVLQGDRIEICNSSRGVTFLQLEDHSYFSVLTQKLHWRGSSL